MADDERDSGVLVAHAGKVTAVITCAIAGSLMLAGILEQLGAAPDLVASVLVALLLVLVAVMSWAARTASPIEFTAAGRALPLAPGALAALAAFAPAGTLLTLCGTLYSLGFDGLAFLLGPAAGLALSALLLAPYLARSGAATIPDFVGLRFGVTAQTLTAVAVLLTSVPMLAAGLSLLAGLTGALFALTPTVALGVAVGAVLLCTLPGGMNSTSWSGTALGLILLFALLVPSFFIVAKVHGSWLPPIAYGEALAAIAKLETSMIEKGLALAQTMKPHTKPFLQLDSLNFSALLLTLAVGTAVLPPLLSRASTSRSARDARATSAWTLMLAAVLLLTAPVYAAYAKLSFYGAIEKRIPLASLPDWMEAPSREGNLRIHGLSLGLFEAAVAAVRDGKPDLKSATAFDAARDGDAGRIWQGLKEPVRTLVRESAQSVITAGKAPAWDVFRIRLLPAVAAVSGNKQAVLTLSSLEASGETIVRALPEMLSLPAVVAALLMAGAAFAALALAASSAMVAGTALTHDLLARFMGPRPALARTALAGRAGLVAVAAAAAMIARSAPETPANLVVMATGIAAAALAPALVLGIWWKRTSATGAALGILTGIAVALYYALATRYTPVAFVEMWGALSSATPSAARSFANLQAAWSAAAEGEAKSAAWMALEAQARGGIFHPGPANWFGVTPLAAALFALPSAFIVTVLVSLVTPRPGPAAAAFVAAMRQPGDPETGQAPSTTL